MACAGASSATWTAGKQPARCTARPRSSSTAWRTATATPRTRCSRRCAESGSVRVMDPDHARDLLARERARIEQQLARLAPDPSDELADYDQHPADEGTEVFEQERDEGIADQLRDELAAIERAERRLEDGTYGVSVVSGRPIPDGRLEAVPWADRTEDEEERRA